MNIYIFRMGFFEWIVYKLLLRRLKQIRQRATKMPLKVEEKESLMYGLITCRALDHRRLKASALGIEDEELIVEEFSKRYFEYYNKRTGVLDGLRDEENYLWEGLLKNRNKRDD